MSRGVFTVKEVHAEFEKLLRDRRHMGLRNLMGDTSSNREIPFQKRAAEAEAVGGCSCVGIALLGLLIFSYFHLRERESLSTCKRTRTSSTARLSSKKTPRF